MTILNSQLCFLWQIPLVMSFAGPERDRSREIRKEAAYFLQQLCQSRLQVHQIYILLLLLILLFFLVRHRVDLLASLQLLDIANVHSLPWNTNSGGIS